jgi:hypothetical protein
MNGIEIKQKSISYHPEGIFKTFSISSVTLVKSASFIEKNG